MKLVEAFVDGGCSPNPGPGAFAAILDYKGHIKEFKKEGQGTSNQMEMRAALLALDSLKESCEIHIYTDSQYLYKGMTKWFRHWKGNSWRTAEGKEVTNKNLWRQLDAVTRRHHVHWHWIRGHNGNPMHEQAHHLVQGLLNIRPKAHTQAAARRRSYRRRVR